MKISIFLLAVFLGIVYKAIQPPPPKICGSPNGPPVTSSRIKLRDGRHLAYLENGIPKENAAYKIILVHGAANSRHSTPLPSPELIEELKIYVLTFDRAGYGESDPNPKRSVKSDALDIEQLADHLELGSRFYVIGNSLGGYVVWGCLKYIPHRLAGAALVGGTVNYWWPSFPANLTRDGFQMMLPQDRRVLRIAHYAPCLFHWWMTQKWFLRSAIVERNHAIYYRQDLELLPKMIAMSGTEKAQQQGEFESHHRDIMVGFGNWDFDPMDLPNPFPHNEGSVHIWQGYEDRIVPFFLHRYLVKRLPWINYHEIPEGGHFIIFADGFADRVVHALVLGEEPSATSI